MRSFWRFLIVKADECIFRADMGAETMLKHAQRNIPVAKPRGKPIDIAAGVERVMNRYPKIMARLAE